MSAASPASTGVASPPIARFFRMIEEAPLPVRADRAAAGTLPARAARYCDAVTAASGFGWWIFPPMEFSLLWDGEDIFWSYDGEWWPLAAAQFPHQAAHFDAAAPAALRGCSPPFLTKLPEPGMVQIWTGLLARTAPEWSLLLRPLANLPSSGGYALYEGIIETDRWFGPLFTNLRLTRTDVPVRFCPDFPLLQAQPLLRRLYTDDVLDDLAIVPDLASFSPADWQAYEETIAEPDKPIGAYAVAARRPRKADQQSVCPRALLRT